MADAADDEPFEMDHSQPDPTPIHAPMPELDVPNE